MKKRNVRLLAVRFWAVVCLVCMLATCLMCFSACGKSGNTDIPDDKTEIPDDKTEITDDKTEITDDKIASCSHWFGVTTDYTIVDGNCHKRIVRCSLCEEILNRGDESHYYEGANSSCEYCGSTRGNTAEITYIDFVITADNRADIGFTGKEGETLAIPAVFQGADGALYKVVGIGDYVFEYCDGLSGVIIPDTVKYVGKGAFQFSDLMNVVIGDSVTSIGDGAFKYCAKLVSVIIPNSVTSIGDSAFQQCLWLESVTISDSVTEIGKYAFYQCYALKSVAIPEGVTSIGDYAFQKCSVLRSVTIPDSVTSIGNYAFDDCTKLANVYYTGTEEQWNAITVSEKNDALTGATIAYNYTGN